MVKAPRTYPCPRHCGRQSGREFDACCLACAWHRPSHSPECNEAWRLVQESTKHHTPQVETTVDAAEEK
jgi:hypothetical protein